MDIRISPGRLRGRLEAVSSKSDMHRALICAAFSDRETEIFCNLLSRDIEATMDCLKALGAGIERNRERGSFTVTPAPFKDGGEGESPEKEPRELLCGESGSTLRFMLPVAAAVGGSYEVKGEGRLPERPIGPLTRLLKGHGVRFSREKLPFIMEGRLKGESFEIEGNISSQFITGLLLSFPLMEEREAELKITTELESSAYVDITLSVMKAFGAELKRTERGYRLEKKKPGYTSPVSYRAEGDWSNSAMWLCGGALGGNLIEISGLSEDSPQGDKEVAEILRRMKEEGEVSVDVSGIPDLVPALAVTAAFRRGETRFINGARLRIKECDRLSATAENLTRLGVTVKEGEDQLIIEGRPRIEGGVRLSGFNDHRMVMSAAIIGAMCEKPVIIEGAEAVKKSYPGFFEDFRKLGGKADVI